MDSQLKENLSFVSSWEDKMLVNQGCYRGVFRGLFGWKRGWRGRLAE